jgi:hypothetical protein
MRTIIRSNIMDSKFSVDMMLELHAQVDVSVVPESYRTANVQWYLNLCHAIKFYCTQTLLDHTIYVNLLKLYFDILNATSEI